MTPRVHREWSNRVAAEYRSAAITAQVLHWLISVGANDALVSTCMRIVRDELDHAQLSHDCLVALGGGGQAQLDLSNMAEPTLKEGVVASLLDSVLQNFCLGETFAVPLFNRMYEGTTQPDARRVLTRVLQDEAVHRGFGWDALDALLESDGQAVRTFVSARLPHHVARFHQAYAPRRDGVPLTEQERCCGLMDLKDYREVWTRTYTDDVTRRFAKRGITAPPLGEPHERH